jgi:hypothetical protein
LPEILGRRDGLGSNSSRGLVRLEAGERLGWSWERMVQEFRNGWKWYVQGSGRDWEEVVYEQGKGKRIAGDDKG